MDKERITQLLKIGQYVYQVPEEKMLGLLRREITDAFVKNGVHRGMAKENFEQEVAFCAKRMHEELLADRAYSHIRDAEIPYIMSEGIKGRLGTDKDIVLTYKSIVRWIEAYVSSPIRREAVDSHIKEIQRNRALPPSKEMSDEDRKRMVNDAWHEFITHMESLEKRTKGVSIGEVKPLGEFVFPLSCCDYGGIRLEYMREHGYAGEDDSFVDVLERAYNNGKRFVKISQ